MNVASKSILSGPLLLLVLLTLLQGEGWSPHSPLPTSLSLPPLDSRCCFRRCCSQILRCPPLALFPPFPPSRTATARRGANDDDDGEGLDHPQEGEATSRRKRRQEDTKRTDDGATRSEQEEEVAVPPLPPAQRAYQKRKANPSRRRDDDDAAASKGGEGGASSKPSRAVPKRVYKKRRAKVATSDGVGGTATSKGREAAVGNSASVAAPKRANKKRRANEPPKEGEEEEEEEEGSFAVPEYDASALAREVFADPHFYDDDVALAKRMREKREAVFGPNTTVGQVRREYTDV
jgi:hypothetical protein